MIHVLDVARKRTAAFCQSLHLFMLHAWATTKDRDSGVDGSGGGLLTVLQIEIVATRKEPLLRFAFFMQTNLKVNCLVNCLVSCLVSGLALEARNNPICNTIAVE